MDKAALLALADALQDYQICLNAAVCIADRQAVDAAVKALRALANGDDRE